MVINFNSDKAIEALSKIKIPYLTLFLAFISSYNLWFLSIYFFKNSFIENHGLILTLLFTLALTTCWFLITAMYIPKFFILILWDLGVDASDDDISKNSFIINSHIFFEVIFMHCIFLYCAYFFKWSFFNLITIQFIIACVLYIGISVYALKSYEKKHKSDK